MIEPREPRMRESDYLEEDNDLVKKLRQISVLKSFHTEDFNGLIQLSKIRVYDPGEQIIKEGDNDCWIYFLISGEVRVEKKGKQLAIINCIGDVFGEMAIINVTLRSASVFAVGETACLASDVSYIDRLQGIEKFRFGYFLFKTLAKVTSDRLRINSEHLIAKKQKYSDGKEFLTELDSDPDVFCVEQDALGFLEEVTTIDTSQDTGKFTGTDSIEPCLILKGDVGEIKVHNGEVIGRNGVGREILKNIGIVSRKHARFSISDNIWHLEDLKSKNGTILNNTRLLPHTLYKLLNSDTVRFPDKSGNEISFAITISI